MLSEDSMKAKRKNPRNWEEKSRPNMTWSWDVKGFKSDIRYYFCSVTIPDNLNHRGEFSIVTLSNSVK